MNESIVQKVQAIRKHWQTKGKRPPRGIRRQCRELLRHRSETPKQPKANGSAHKGAPTLPNNVPRVNVQDLPVARSWRTQTCPYDGCGDYNTPPKVSVFDGGTNHTVRVRQCMKCRGFYRDAPEPPDALTTPAVQTEEPVRGLGWYRSLAKSYGF